MMLRLKPSLIAFLPFFLPFFLGVFLSLAPAFAAPCPPHIDPVYCQMAEATGGHISTPEDDLAATILTQMDEAKQTRELQSSVLDVAATLRALPVLWLLLLAPLMPLLTMLGLSFKRQPSPLNHAVFAFGTASAPLLTLGTLGALMGDGFSLNITALTMGALMSGALCLPALVFSLIARHHKPTLWGGSLLISGLTAYAIYIILYRGLH